MDLGYYRRQGHPNGFGRWVDGPVVFLSAAGWSSPVARRAHNPKVGGSNPSPATKSRSGYATYPDLFYLPPGIGVAIGCGMPSCAGECKPVAFPRKIAIGFDDPRAVVANS